MKLSVIGCGYLGAVHAACRADLGHDVVGVDVDEAKVASLAAGVPPFHEPGFAELLQRASHPGGRLEPGELLGRPPVQDAAGFLQQAGQSHAPDHVAEAVADQDRRDLLQPPEFVQQVR